MNIGKLMKLVIFIDFWLQLVVNPLFIIYKFIYEHNLFFQNQHDLNFLNFQCNIVTEYISIKIIIQRTIF